MLGRDAIDWERGAGVAALSSGLELRSDAERLQKEAARRLPGAVISVGVGRIQADALALRTSYTEALRALQVGGRAGGPGKVCLFVDLGLDRLLSSCPADELEAFYSATLGPLLGYERAHPGVELAETLRVYLAVGRNVAKGWLARGK
jgi:DNA-binding PucR family transcriptional regulator